MKNPKCTLCNKEITGLQISSGNGGFAHSHCYERTHVPCPANSLYQVARGSRDPGLAAEVINELVPDELAQKIVEEYNKRMLKNWLRRCCCNESGCEV